MGRSYRRSRRRSGDVGCLGSWCFGKLWQWLYHRLGSHRLVRSANEVLHRCDKLRRLLDVCIAMRRRSIGLW